jgi:hypothetical protein
MTLVIGDWLGFLIVGIVLLVIGVVLQRHVAEGIIKTIGYALWIIGIILVIVGFVFLIFAFI